MALLNSSRSTALQAELAALCRQVLPSILLDPGVRILAVEVSPLSTSRFDSEEPKTCYLVSIETNDASMVRGRARSLKGSYKERLEAVLDDHAKRAAPGTIVFLEIRGPESNSVERLLPISEMTIGGKLSKSSPIVRAAESNGIGYIQIRGRHLIAPSPAIAEFLENYAEKHIGNIRSVLDLFAGTAVATKVICRVAHPESVIVVDNDSAKIEHCRRHISHPSVKFSTSDAMTYPITAPIDLVVADPYYEDVEEFLSRQLKAMARFAQNILLVPGNVEDRIWNDRMSSLLEQGGYTVAQHALYGQVVLEASHRTNLSSRKNKSRQHKLTADS
jgi:16S rRNA G966 N2-methylase RsmD